MENENEDVNTNKNVNNKGFKKPTIAEIKEYCKARPNDIDAETFYDFYESKNWMIGKNKMKDWQACIRTWERNSKPKSQVRSVREGGLGTNARPNPGEGAYDYLAVDLYADEEIE